MTVNPAPSPLQNVRALDAFWMPFTANRQFKKAPRLLASASGMHYATEDGRKVLDGTAGLWCVNAGHGREQITRAVERQLATLDYAPTFQMGHPIAFDFAERLAEIAPGEGAAKLDRVFFTGSGSESVDTALKIAIAYQRAIGQGTRTRLIGRERGYHGVGFGGISVGGLVNNRRVFPQLPGSDHLRHTHDLKRNAFTRGIPEHGAELADDLERIVQLHGAETIAAVIVEPMAGSTGVLVPPKGYLERVREIATRHGILLIFDEVITGFGRVGDAATSAGVFGVTPDILTLAKGLTNATVPMGAVVASREIYRTFMDNGGAAYMVEFPHGYTYSAHPVACAAGLAALELFERERLWEKAAALAPHFETALHGLKGLKHVTDIRNYGLAGAVTIAALPGEPARRPYEIAMACWKAGFYVRYGGDTLQFGPHFITEPAELDALMNAVADAIQATA